MGETLTFELEYELLEKPLHTASAVVVAAGDSKRMQGQNKQFLTLRGIPVLARTLLAFQHCPETAEIVVVCKEEDIPSVQKMIDRYRIDRCTSIVPGGSDRQQSVENGIKACDKNAELFAIHDGARPLISPDLISAAVDAAAIHGAAAPALPIVDTVKTVDSQMRVLQTPDREHLMRVQTPQVFQSSLYIRALEYTKQHELRVTDDCSMVEAVGEPVFLIPGDKNNIKITAPEDLLYAEFLLNEEGKVI